MGPLSVTTCSGNPYVANSRLSSSTVLEAVVLHISIISGHFESASIISGNILLRNTPVNQYTLFSMALSARARGVVRLLEQYFLLFDMIMKSVQLY